MIFRIRTVDMFGFLGREHHPEPQDVGLLVLPVKMETYDSEMEAILAPGEALELDPTALAVLDALDGTEPNDEKFCHCWTCVTKDGRFIQLMDFEVELYRS